MTFLKNTQHHLVQQQSVIAQVEQPSDRSRKDPLIDYSAEYLIDFGVVLIVGMISKQTKTVLLFALALSAFFNYYSLEYLILV